MCNSRKAPTEIEPEQFGSACAGLGESILVPAENTEVKKTNPALLVHMKYMCPLS